MILYLKVDRCIWGIVICIFNVFFFFVICVLYIVVLIKVWFSFSCYYWGVINREWKLIIILIWVIFVFLLFWLLFNVFVILLSFSKVILIWFWVDNVVVIFVGVNFLVNLIVYVIRMLEFRVGVRNILCKVFNCICFVNW